MSVLAVDGDSAEVMRRKHVGSVTRTVDPARNCTLHRVYLSIIICNILGETTLEERYFLTALIEVGVPDRYFPVCHCNAVFHCDVVQCLIPRKGR